MNLLLDSHAFLWAIGVPGRLSQPAQLALAAPANRVQVSAVSFWEISLKSALGKLELQAITPADLPRIATEHGFRVLALDADTAATFHRLPVLGRDPFDRLLVWQAIRGGMILVSGDRAMTAHEPHGLSLLW